MTFRLTNVIPERIIFVSRGITVFASYHLSAVGVHISKSPRFRDLFCFRLQLQCNKQLWSPTGI